MTLTGEVYRWICNIVVYFVTISNVRNLKCGCCILSLRLCSMRQARKLSIRFPKRVDHNHQSGNGPKRLSSFTSYKGGPTVRSHGRKFYSLSHLTVVVDGRP
jgi:hypothetical protein